MGVRVEPWALRYFGVAFASYLAALAAMAAGLTYPSAGLLAPTTLAAVHLVTVGWLTLLMLGALHQFVPVITGRRLASDRSPAATLLLVAGGLILMVAGFLALPGGPWPALPAGGELLLPLGGSAVVAGAAVALANLGRTLGRARPLSLPARYVASALGFLALTVLLGLTFALAMTWPGLLPAGMAGPLLGAGLPLHLLAGVGGWFTLTAMGVALKLLAMFTLAPEDRGKTGQGIWAVTAGGMALAWLAGLAGVFAPGSPAGVLARAGWGLTGTGVALYLVDIRRLFGQRRRRGLEINARFGAWALGCLGLTLLACAWALLRGREPGSWALAVFLALFGWLSGLGLSQLYKIVPFLTWIERYGKRMGRERVPRVQDLVQERRARPWFQGYFGAVALAAAALAIPSPALFRAAAALMLLAAAGVGRELLASRRCPRASPGHGARDGPAGARDAVAGPRGS